MRNCRVYVWRRIGNRDFRLCCTLVPVPAASYPPRGRQFTPLLCTISPHLRLRPLPGHRYRLSPCPWLPFTVTWLGRDLPALADSPASSRALPGTQRQSSCAARLATSHGGLGWHCSILSNGGRVTTLLVMRLPELPSALRLALFDLSQDIRMRSLRFVSPTDLHHGQNIFQT